MDPATVLTLSIVAKMTVGISAATAMYVYDYKQCGSHQSHYQILRCVEAIGLVPKPKEVWPHP